MSDEAVSRPSGPPPGTFRHDLKVFWAYFCENRGSVVGLAFVVLIVFLAVFADLIAPVDPTLAMLTVPVVMPDSATMFATRSVRSCMRPCRSVFSWIWC